MQKARRRISSGGLFVWQERYACFFMASRSAMDS